MNVFKVYFISMFVCLILIVKPNSEMAMKVSGYKATFFSEGKIAERFKGK